LRTREGEVSEGAWIARVIDGPPGQVARVVARAGAGKSRLAWSLEAQACGRIPTVRLDVDAELRTRLSLPVVDRPALTDAVLAALDPDGQGGDALQRMGHRPWLLLLDGADELGALDRQRLERDLPDLIRQSPGMRLLRFERLPLVPSAAAPTLTAQLPDVACAQADEMWARLFRSEDERSRALAWRRAHGLDRRTADGRAYVHARTWRELHLLADLARDAAAGMDDVPTDAGRLDLYAAWAEHGLAALGGTTESRWNWLDGLTQATAVARGAPEPQWTGELCRTTTTPPGLSAQDACKRLEHSRLVTMGKLAGTWTFVHASLADLARSRWLARHTLACEPLARSVVEDGSLEAFALVAAMPQGRACLPQLVAQACQAGAAAVDLADRLDEALAIGQPIRLESSIGPTSPCVRLVQTVLADRRPSH